ncbi:hypothetical protein [Taylorella asinigenitalis]|nr:hypothetical protein [Taylorella asinigenitalis]
MPVVPVVPVGSFEAAAQEILVPSVRVNSAGTPGVCQPSDADKSPR